MLSDGCIKKLLTQDRSTILLVEHWRNLSIPELNVEWLQQQGRKRSLSLTLATFSVKKKVPERRKNGISDRSIFESEKEKAEDLQPTKKRHTKPSAPKGKQRSKLNRYCWKSISKGYIPKIPMTQWVVSMYNGLCRTRSQRRAVLKLKLSPWTHP